MRNLFAQKEHPIERIPQKWVIDWGKNTIFGKKLKAYNMEPFMIYSGKHVFHFTKFESALRIIATKSLKFGRFENMNDIAEVKKYVYGMVPADVINKELSNYQSISLTLDNSSHRGFYIDPLWGHYAQGGNGACLVFDKDKLSLCIKDQFGEKAICKPIKYLSEHTNAIFTKGESIEEVKKNIGENIRSIFFTKSIDWKYEQELRILIKTDDTNEKKLYWKDSLLAVILCLPKVVNYKDSAEFKILKSTLPNIPILNYTTSLGNKKLLNEQGKKVCDIIGKDLQLCFE